MKGKLYLVATPIGNLEDITLRAIRVLKEVDIIAAEDTRHTLQLLNHLNISKPLISYYKQIEKNKSDVLIQKILEGKDIALVSDAGTPGISDPGEQIVRDAIKEQIEIIPIPGACALINALICSGISEREFVFIGFLPNDKKEKKIKINDIKEFSQTIILYEAPHKLINTLNLLRENLGNRKIVLAKELTKIHEKFIYTDLEEAGKIINEPKGEFVIVLEGNKNKRSSLQEQLKNLKLEEHYKYYENQGLEKKEIIKRVSKDRECNKNEIYQYFIKKEHS